MRNQFKQKYYTQKCGAKCRGIEWHFTFDSWIEWWGEDFANRGNKSGQLVMARRGDVGPYHPDNVYKITCNENHSEAHANGLAGMTGKTHTAESRAKISAGGKGKVRSAEIRSKMNISKKGIPRTAEVREKIRATLLAKRQG
jgi:hypothetical protein